MTETRIRSLIWVAMCAGTSAALLWLSLLPADVAPDGLGWDKLNHAGAMAVATLLAFFALQPRRWASLVSFLYGSFLGILIEILQATMTTTRKAEWGDVLADLSGAGFVWVIALLIRWKKRR